MASQEKEQKKSSLPSSLIPHLFSGPVVSLPRDSSTRSTYSPPTLPAIVTPDEEEASNSNIQGERTYGQPSVTPPFHLMPHAAPIPPTPSSTAAPFNHSRSPRRYFSFDSRPAELPNRPRQPDLSAPEIHVPLAEPPPAIPPLHEPHTFVPVPVYGNPIYHATRTPTGARDSSLTLPMPMPIARQPVLQRASWDTDAGSTSMFHSEQQREPPHISMTAWRESEAGSSSLLHPVPREPPILRTSWREGEAGPSSLMPPSMYRDQLASGGRRGSSQPAPLRRFNTSQSEDWPGAGSEHFLREEEYMSAGGMNLPQHGMYGFHPDSSFHQWPTFPPLPGMAESQPYAYPYPPIGEVGALSLSSSAPGSSIRSGHTPELPDSSGEASQKSMAKRKRSKDVPEEEGQRKSHASRKTAVACNFCRGRKLRCNGARPACSNCIARKYQCEYVPIQRRRGPGKAPKRSRSKKDSGSAGGMHYDGYGGMNSLRASDGRPSPSAADYELEALAPELRPYTSVMSLERFSYQPPEASSPYSGPPSPEMILPREARTPQSLETSSEDGSEGEEGRREEGVRNDLQDKRG